MFPWSSSSHLGGHICLSQGTKIYLSAMHEFQSNLCSETVGPVHGRFSRGRDVIDDRSTSMLTYLLGVDKYLLTSPLSDLPGLYCVLHANPSPYKLKYPCYYVSKQAGNACLYHDLDSDPPLNWCEVSPKLRGETPFPLYLLPNESKLIRHNITGLVFLCRLDQDTHVRGDSIPLHVSNTYNG
jgi:hypothetical protein